MGKTQQQQTQPTLEFSQKCSSFLLYIIFKTSGGTWKRYARVPN